jgi:8-oxo-dGTP pyrophosphatase MutT (NUDIX family)
MQNTKFISFIEKMKFSFSKGLPGREFQYLMAPEDRHQPNKQSLTKKAAVMALFYPDKDNIVRLILIKRNDYNGPHSGQISFPGGMYEESDIDLKATALRETAEETGVNSEHIEFLGELSALNIPVSNFTVQPYAAYLNYEPDFKPDPFEVKYLILADLNNLLNKKIRKKETWLLMNKEIEVPFYHINDEKIWGATAMMLSELMVIIERAEQW